MKNSINLFLLAAAVLAVASCNPKSTRSKATFDVSIGFELTDNEIETYFHDGLMFAKTYTFDQIAYFLAEYDDNFGGHRGGFTLSVRTGNDADQGQFASFTSASTNGGATPDGSATSYSRGYMAFDKTTTMPDHDIVFDYSSYYSGSAQVIGCYICNTLFNKRLLDNGEIKPGDYLKVTAEFYNGTALLGSVETYLVDYTGPELKMSTDWEVWDMNKQLEEKGGTPTNVNAVKFNVACAGSSLKPEFCLDNFAARVDIEY